MSAVTYRAEVVGSLLRPAYLKEAVRRHEDREIGDAGLRAAQDRAVLEAVELQESCGIEVITDGEMRRVFWFDPLTRGLGGYGASRPVGLFQKGEVGAQLLPVLTGKLRLERNLPLEELEYLREHAHRPSKATLPSLTYASVLWADGMSSGVYPSREEYLEEALRLTRELVAQLAGAGVTYVQLDAPRYTQMISEKGKESMRDLGLDPGTWLDEMIGLDNALMAGFPEVTFGVHVCRGNNQSMWYAEGGYDAVAERLFSELRCQRLFLEYDTPRAGTFPPLRFVSPDKTVVLGLVTTKEPLLESDDDLERRITEASEYVPVERLALSPQCGFASTLPGNLIDEDAQRRKLETVARVAAKVW